jgi:phage shock protein PspC (stress-responsive transcriptional regulator)
MTDEAAESRGPATTGTGPSLDEPAPSAAPEPEDEPTVVRTDEPTAHIPTAHIPPPDDPPAEAPPADDPPAEAPPAGDPPPAAGPPDPPPATDPPPWFGTAAGVSFSREKLVRPTQGRYIAGVCAALGRATNTDPVLWRVLLVVLALFGGVGVLIYLLGWLGTTAEGDTASPIESLLGRGRSRMGPLSVVLLGAATVVTFAFIVHDGFRATVLGGAVLLGVALLVRRNSGADPVAAARSTPASAPPPPASGSGAGFPFEPMDRTAAFATAGAAPFATAAAPATAAGDPATTTAPPGEPLTPPLTPPLPPRYQPPQAPQFTAPAPDEYRQPFAPHGPYAGRPPTAPPKPPKTPKPPKPPKERSKLGRITFFALLMVLGVLALIDVAGASVPVSGYFAAALATIGLGLIVGAWFGRARGLIALALVTSLGLGIATGVERFGGQVANSDYHPQNLAQVADRYDFKFGNMTLDLRAVDFTGADQAITVAMNIGQVKVLLPAKVDTTTAVTMDGGRAVVFGHEYDNDSVKSIDVTDAGTDGAGGGTLRLTIQLQGGNVEVSR